MTLPAELAALTRPTFNLTAHLARSAEVRAFDLLAHVKRTEARSDVRARFAALVAGGR